MNNVKMDGVFYLTIISGLIAVVISAVTYYNGRQKEIAADSVTNELLNRTRQVAELQAELLKITDQNQKQILGSGFPTLYATDQISDVITLGITNDNDYPLYDVSLAFADPIKAMEKTFATKGNNSFGDFKSFLITIAPFNLPKQTKFDFYNFKFPENQLSISFFISIVTRNGSYTGQIIITKNSDSFSYQSRLSDMGGKLLFNQTK